MNLKELVKGLKTIDIIGDLEKEITDIAYDSRKVKSGTLFVAIEGTTVDAHKFVPQAVASGAAAIVVQKDVPVDGDIAVIKVEDSRFALGYLSDAFFGHPSRKFNLIGVTGTKGKTTTTYMIKAILEKAGQKTGLIGTVANMIGDRVFYATRTTPESYDLQELFSEMAESRVDTSVMEVSSHALELHRVACCDFNIGIFNNLSQDHLDFHQTFENYLEAKAKLFKMCKTGFINIDNDYGQKVIDRATCKIYTLGIEKPADIKASNIIYHPASVEFDYSSPWGSDRITVNIPGKFTVYNALGAVSSSLLLGISLDEIKEGIKSVKVPGRAEIIETGRDFTIMIDYAHSPDSLENILETVRAFAPARVVCLFGCGGDRDKTKRPIMGEISSRLADFSIITSDNPRTEDPGAIIEDILVGIKDTGKPYIAIEDRTKAIKYAIENAKPKDVIILAGKGHETYQILKDKTIHYDEREIVKNILENK